MNPDPQGAGADHDQQGAPAFPQAHEGEEEGHPQGQEGDGGEGEGQANREEDEVDDEDPASAEDEESVISQSVQRGMTIILAQRFILFSGSVYFADNSPGK